MKQSAWGVALVVSLAAAYFGIGALILHYGLDNILWPQSRPDGPLPPPAFSSATEGSESIVRAVGPASGHCVVFFPGHGGGFLRYAHDLFPSLTSAGLQVWAISYPGQDDAPGRAGRMAVLSQIRSLLTVISKQCPRQQTVFLGRSLGANVAAVAAASWHPRGLVLEGAGGSLALAVRHRLSSHWFTRMLELLPIDSLVAPDFPLATSVAQFGVGHTILFQGQLDEVAPVTDLEPLRRMGVTVHVVANATHTNAYLLAGPLFVSTLARGAGLM